MLCGMVFGVTNDVFGHDDSRIHQHPDRDRDAAQRHDIRVDPLQAHDREREQDAERQSDDCDQR